MRIFELDTFPGGWFLGNFTPSILPSTDFEIAVKYLKAGTTEASHFQRTATEVTVVIDGLCRLGARELEPGKIVVIPPMESAEFCSLTDCILVCIKFPSIPNDKVVDGIVSA